MKCTIILLMVLFSNIGHSQTFHYLPMPKGVITAAACDAKGTFYIGSPSGGVYSSTDAGETWARLSLATLGSSAVHVFSRTKEGRIIAGTDQGGVRILQPSNVWKAFNTGLPNAGGGGLMPNIRALTCDSAGHFYAGSRSGNLAPMGLFTAADTNSPWIDISASLPTKEILALATSPAGKVYCGTDGFGVYVYDGASWSPLNTNLAELHPNILLFDAAGNLFAGTNAGISVLKNNANSWINYPVGNGTTPVLSLAVDPTDQSRIFAGLGFTQYQAGALRGSIYVSNDTGKTWSNAAPSLTTLRIRSLAVAPGGTVIAGAQGIFRSTDQGKSWNPSSTGFKDVMPAAVGNGFAVTPKKTFVTGTEYGIYRSTDQGQSWHDANNGLKYPLIEFVFCDSLGYLFACAHALPRHESSVNRLYRSTDDGLSWDTVKISLDGIYSQIAQGKNNELYIAHGFGAQPPSATIIGSSCAKSTDRGATWFDLPCLGGGKGFSVGMTKQGSILFGGESLGLFRSTDGGASWDTTIHVGPGGNMAPVAVSPGGDIFTCTYGDRHLWFSDSASDGRSYTNMVSPSFPMYTSASSFQWSSTGRMYVGVKGNPPNPGVYYTDAPYTANSVFTSIPNFYFNAAKMLWDDDGYLWVYGSGALARSDSVLTAPRKTTSVKSTVDIPSEFMLEQNYPNPFNPSTTIGFTLQVSGFTTLKIYDALGREVSVLVNNHQESGRYSVEFDAAKLSSGIYIYKLTSGSFTQTKKMLMVK